MFELEILELLKKIKSATDEYELKKLKKSLCNLIKENQQKYENFIQMQVLDNQTLKIFNECEKIEIEENQNKNNETSDFEIIKKYYLNWLRIYQNNNGIVNEQNEIIINQIITFYAQNRIEVLIGILKTNDDENFEAFKNMLQNYLRKYFAEKINKYYTNENYLNLGFFNKRKKKKKILEILDSIGKYEFDIDKINEVLK